MAAFSLNVLHVEHQALELFFDKAHFPRFISALEVFQIIVAVRIDEVELPVTRVVSLLLEELIQVVIRLPARVAPDDEHLLAFRVRAFYDPEAANSVNVPEAQSEQVVEGFDKVNSDRSRLAYARASSDVELIIKRVYEGFDVEETG